MKAKGFHQLLEQLREENAEEQERRDAFKVSAGVGLAVLSLAPEKKAAAAMPCRYEETPAKQRSEPPLSLAGLPGEIAKAATVRELRRLRRQFARQSHPDRCAAAGATPEMAAANRLIDDAIAALRRR